MVSLVSSGYAFNRTRNAYLATNLSVAGTHWSRLRGLMGKDAASFPAGQWTLDYPFTRRAYPGHAVSHRRALPRH